MLGRYKSEPMTVTIPGSALFIRRKFEVLMKTECFIDIRKYLKAKKNEMFSITLRGFLG